MQLAVKIYLPFRLKLLLTLLAAAGAAFYLSYSGFRKAAGPFSEQAAGEQLMAGLDIAAAVIDAETNSALESARLLAARPGMREILLNSRAAAGPEQEKEFSSRLTAQAAGIAGLTRLDLADARGRVTASMEKGGRGTDLSRQRDFRLGIKGKYIGAPREDKNSMSYDITVPVSAAGGKAGPLGALRCRFAALPAQRAALKALRTDGAALALAKLGGQKMLLTEGNAPGRELSLKAPETAAFLWALEGKDRTHFSSEEGEGKAIYACRPLNGPDWILAIKVPYFPAAQRAGGLLERARLNALLAFIFLAAASFLAVSSLTAPLRELGREAATLLERCGRPVDPDERLCEPEILVAAVSEAASTLKHQTSRDVELETETEKLREEEADLKAQNEELEKLNKYLMEREIKISELKKEISELREKVGDTAI